METYVGIQNFFIITMASVTTAASDTSKTTLRIISILSHLLIYVVINLRAMGDGDGDGGSLQSHFVASNNKGRRRRPRRPPKARGPNKILIPMYTLLTNFLARSGHHIHNSRNNLARLQKPHLSPMKAKHKYIHSHTEEPRNTIAPSPQQPTAPNISQKAPSFSTE